MNKSKCIKLYKKPSQIEYETLRLETIERISIMNNQASSAISIMVSTWGAGFVLLGIEASLEKISQSMVWLLSTGEMIAFFFAILMLLPMAIKSGENLRQLISLGIYIRIFYEYLPRYYEENNSKNLEYMWETVDKRVNEVVTTKGINHINDRLFNMEYCFLSLCSFFFF